MGEWRGSGFSQPLGRNWKQGCSRILLVSGFPSQIDLKRLQKCHLYLHHTCTVSRVAEMEGAGAEGAGMKGVERIEEENPMGILSSPPGDTPPPSTRTCSSIGSNSFREIAGLLSWWGGAARVPSTCNAGSTACPALVGRVSTVSPQVSSKSLAPTQTCLRGSFEAASRPPCNYLQGACITLTKARGTWRKRRWMGSVI